MDNMFGGTDSQDHQNRAGSDDGDGDNDAGINAILDLIKKFYPTQENHVQTYSLIKCWMGGPDPLDYVSILNNAGNEAEGIPPHWHYITFGFSDLHGDGRVHEFKGPGEPSGFGFELTFRLRKEASDIMPPMWPTRVMNSLARYVFRSGSVLDVNDHIPWTPLDKSPENPDTTTKIQNMLITEDFELKSINTRNGTVHFRQLVGITDDELRLTQTWNGIGMLQLLSSVPEVCGKFHVTDMKRLSVFVTHPHVKQIADEGINREGSNLGMIVSAFHWESDDQDAGEQEAIKSVKYANLNVNMQTAEIIPRIVKGRIKKNRECLMVNTLDQTVRFIQPDNTDPEVHVSEAKPMVILAEKGEIQVYCGKAFQAEMVQVLKPLESMKNVTADPPTVFQLHNPNLKVSVVQESELPCIRFPAYDGR